MKVRLGFSCQWWLFSRRVYKQGEMCFSEGMFFSSSYGNSPRFPVSYVMSNCYGRPRTKTRDLRRRAYVLYFFHTAFSKIAPWLHRCCWTSECVSSFEPVRRKHFNSAQYKFFFMVETRWNLRCVFFRVCSFVCLSWWLHGFSAFRKDKRLNNPLLVAWSCRCAYNDRTSRRDIRSKVKKKSKRKGEVKWAKRYTVFAVYNVPG